MNIYEKLLGFLHRVFNKNPGSFVAFQIAYDGTDLTWVIAYQTLTLTAVGGTGASLTIDLSEYTVASLATYIGSQTGYAISYVDTSELSALSALVLIEASGDINVTGGNNLLGYTSLLWAYYASIRPELYQAKLQIANLPAEMSTPTADTIWLDFIGGDVFGIPRESYTINGVVTPEMDEAYAPRIPSEVLQPRGNNIAIAEAIRVASGQMASVVDAPTYGGTAPFYNGAITHNGAHEYSGSSVVIYGFFDVTYSYDLEAAQDLTTFQAVVLSTINKFRDAGTQLGSIALQGSQMVDSANPGSDMPINLTVTTTYSYNGQFSYDGSHVYTGSISVAQQD